MAFINGLLTGADIELTVDVVQVFFHRFRRYEQFGGNFLVAQSLCQQIQDFEFAIGQGLNQWLIANGWSAHSLSFECSMFHPALILPESG